MECCLKHVNDVAEVMIRDKAIVCSTASDKKTYQLVWFERLVGILCGGKVVEKKR